MFLDTRDLQVKTDMNVCYVWFIFKRTELCFPIQSHLYRIKKNTISKDNMNIEILPFNLSLDLSSDLKTASGCFPAYSTNLDPYVWLSKAF